jgi:hypothetical protein
VKWQVDMHLGGVGYCIRPHYLSAARIAEITTGVLTDIVTAAWGNTLAIGMVGYMISRKRKKSKEV